MFQMSPPIMKQIHKENKLDHAFISVYITDVIEIPIPGKQLLHVPVCQDTGWVYNVTHICVHAHTFPARTTTFISSCLVILLSFLKDTVKALIVIPTGAFGCCQKYKLII